MILQFVSVHGYNIYYPDNHYLFFSHYLSLLSLHFHLTHSTNFLFSFFFVSLFLLFLLSFILFIPLLLFPYVISIQACPRLNNRWLARQRCTSTGSSLRSQEAHTLTYSCIIIVVNDSWSSAVHSFARV